MGNNCHSLFSDTFLSCIQTIGAVVGVIVIVALIIVGFVFDFLEIGK